MAVKVRKPHDIYLRQVIEQDICEINDYKPRTDKHSVPYYLRLEKEMADAVGFKTQGHNRIIIFKKKPIRIKKEGIHYTTFDF